MWGGEWGKGLAPQVGSMRFRGMCNAGQLEVTIVYVISQTCNAAKCEGQKF